MRVRSHSMETMVGAHRHRSPGVEIENREREHRGIERERAGEEREQRNRDRESRGIDRESRGIERESMGRWWDGERKAEAIITL